MRKPNLFYWFGQLLGFVRRRHKKRKAAPPPPRSPYRRFYTKDRRFEELAPRKPGRHKH